MKILIIYYSLEGNTRFIAEAIAKEIHADLLELKVKNEINTKGFMKYIWGGKQVIQKEQPELVPININLDNYDLIFIGTPVWAFNFTPAIRTFLNSFTLKDKKIALFCTHEGFVGNSIKNMKKILETSNDIIAENDFVNVLKNPQQNSLLAKAWAINIVNLLKKSKSLQ